MIKGTANMISNETISSTLRITTNKCLKPDILMAKTPYLLFPQTQRKRDNSDRDILSNSKYCKAQRPDLRNSSAPCAKWHFSPKVHELLAKFSQIFVL